MRPAISGDMTVNQVLQEYPATLPVFNQYRVDACCGGAARLDVAAAAAGAGPDKSAAPAPQHGGGAWPVARANTVSIAPTSTWAIWAACASVTRGAMILRKTRLRSFAKCGLNSASTSTTSGWASSRSDTRVSAVIFMGQP